MKIVVAGCRHFTDTKAIERVLAGHICPKDVVITGGAKGVDTIAYEYARRMFADTIVYNADWDRHGRAAGPIRNAEMAEEADLVLLFWDGESRGTRSMMNEALKRRIETHIHFVGDPNA